MSRIENRRVVVQLHRQKPPEQSPPTFSQLAGFGIFLCAAVLVMGLCMLGSIYLAQLLGVR